MKKGRTTFSSDTGRTLLGALVLFALVAFTAPQTAQAATPAVGTTITNTVTVSYDEGADIIKTVDIAVTILPAAPTLAFDATQGTDITGTFLEGVNITLYYTLTSNANGDDQYDLSGAISDTAFTATPSTTVNGGTTTVSLGASMASEAAATSTTVKIPGDSADHGFDGTGSETVLIGTAGPYTINSTSYDAATDTTTLTLSTAVTVAAGDPIYEQISFTVAFTTGTLSGSNTTGDHTLTVDAQVNGDATKSATDVVQTITVSVPTLSVTKTADTSGGTAPGDTVTYKITVENTGAAQASNVTITDPIPAYTTYVGTSAKYTDDLITAYGSATQLNDADVYDATGNGTVTYGPFNMASGAQKTLYFQVTIDNN